MPFYLFSSMRRNWGLPLSITCGESGLYAQPYGNRSHILWCPTLVLGIRSPAMPCSSSTDIMQFQGTRQYGHSTKAELERRHCLQMKYKCHKGCEKWTVPDGPWFSHRLGTRWNHSKGWPKNDLLARPICVIPLMHSSMCRASTKSSPSIHGRRASPWSTSALVMFVIAAWLVSHALRIERLRWTYHETQKTRRPRGSHHPYLYSVEVVETTGQSHLLNLYSDHHSYRRPWDDFYQQHRSHHLLDKLVA